MFETRPTSTNGEAGVSRYIAQTRYTDPGRYASLYDDLPSDPGNLCAAIRGLLVHYVANDGLSIAPERLKEIDTRTVEAALARIVDLDPRPLTVARPAEACLVSCCRDYAVLLCSVLRHRGIPARIRFGFATYFALDFLPDHVITEYWNGSRWVLIDAELEPGFAHVDPLDIPRDRFLVAGEAWRRCRRGELDADRCGVHEQFGGLWFIAGYVANDLAALDRIETLPWDNWGITDVPPGAPLGRELVSLIDAVAASSQDSLKRFSADPRLRCSGQIRSHSAAGFYTLSLP